MIETLCANLGGDGLIQVLALKERVEKEFGLGEVSEQKLIRAGKILKDEQTLAESGVKDKDFIVVMVSKAKGAPEAAAAPAAAPAAAAPQSAASAPQPPAAAPQQAPVAAVQNAASQVVVVRARVY